MFCAPGTDVNVREIHLHRSSAPAHSHHVGMCVQDCAAGGGRRLQMDVSVIKEAC